MGKNNISAVRKIISISKSLVICIVSAVGLLAAQSSTVSASEEVYYIHNDHLGSTSVITQNGTEVSGSKYYPYGTERANSLQQTTISKVSEKGYTGQISDKTETGFLYYNARYYDPNLAIFTSPDPVKQMSNSYNYVASNPINHIDPTGHMFMEPQSGGRGPVPNKNSGDSTSETDNPLSPLINNDVKEKPPLNPFSNNPLLGNPLDSNPMLSDQTKEFIEEVNDYCSKNASSQACKDWAELQEKLSHDMLLGTSAAVVLPFVAAAGIGAIPELTISTAVYAINEISVIILSGGKAQVFGMDKSLLQSASDLFGPAFAEVVDLLTRGGAGYWLWDAYHNQENGLIPYNNPFDSWPFNLLTPEEHGGHGVVDGTSTNNSILQEMFYMP